MTILIVAGLGIVPIAAQAADGFDALQEEGLTALAAGDLELALDRYEAMQSAAPENGEVAYNRGTILLGLGRPAEAREALEMAIALGLVTPEVHYNLGNALMQLQMPTEAITAYEAALALDPVDTSTALNLGLALFEAGRRDEALDVLRTSGEDGSLDAWLALGAILLRDDEIAGASDAYASALMIDPTSYTARLNFGTTQYELGDFAGSFATFEALHADEPEDMDVLFNLGMAAIAAALDTAVRVVPAGR